MALLIHHISSCCDQSMATSHRKRLLKLDSDSAISPVRISASTGVEKTCVCMAGINPIFTARNNKRGNANRNNKITGPIKERFHRIRFLKKITVSTKKTGTTTHVSA